MPDRRTLVTIAGGVTLTVLAGSAALAANLGILASADSDVGDLSPVSLPVADANSGDPGPTTTVEPAVETIVVDEYVTVPSGSGAAVPPASGDTSTEPLPPVTADPGPASSVPATAPASAFTNEPEESSPEIEDHGEEEPQEQEHEELEEHEYEGANDDD